MAQRTSKRKNAGIPPVRLGDESPAPVIATRKEEGRVAKAQRRQPPPRSSVVPAGGASAASFESPISFNSTAAPMGDDMRSAALEAAAAMPSPLRPPAIGFVSPIGQVADVGAMASSPMLGAASEQGDDAFKEISEQVEGRDLLDAALPDTPGAAEGFSPFKFSEAEMRELRDAERAKRDAASAHADAQFNRRTAEERRRTVAASAPGSSTGLHLHVEFI